MPKTNKSRPYKNENGEIIYNDFDETKNYIHTYYEKCYFDIKVNKNTICADIHDKDILFMIVYNDYMLDVIDSGLNNYEEIKDKVYKIMDYFYDTIKKIAYSYEDQKPIKAKKEFVECIKQFRRICEKVYQYLDYELNDNDIYGIINTLEFIKDIGQGYTNSRDFDMSEIYDLLSEDTLKLIQLVYIWKNNENKEKKAIRKIEDYYLKALYSPYTPIGVKRLKKSMEELYE